MSPAKPPPPLWAKRPKYKPRRHPAPPTGWTQSQLPFPEKTNATAAPKTAPETAPESAPVINESDPSPPPNAQL